MSQSSHKRARVFNISAAADSTYEDNQADIANGTNNYATWAQITNLHDSQPVSIRLNGQSDAVFTLAAETTQSFNQGEMVLTLIEVDNSTSGASGPVDVQIITSIITV